MSEKMKMFGRRAMAVVIGATLAVPAFAADGDIDVSAVLTKIALCVAPVTAIGGAVLLVQVAAKVWKWARAAL